MKKILVVVGTRPNFMKVSRFKEVAASYPDLQVELVHTGQHADARMTTVFFEQFNMVPDHLLEVPDGSPIARVAQMMLALDAFFKQAAPDLVMVVGDVDSTLAGALVANRCGIPLAHLESGLRSGDMSMPEEVNRIIVDRLADHHFVAEPSGLENLLREGRDASSIHMVGNTMIDTLVAFKDRIEHATVLAELELGGGGHVLVTLHRPATVDDAYELRHALEILQWLARDLKVVYPVHPRTRANLQRFGLWDEVQRNPRLILCEPLDYFAFQKVLTTSLFVLTDSGGIQEETTYLGIPCLTLRPNTERPITVEVGTNQLLPMDMLRLQQAVATIRAGGWCKGRIPDLWDGHATERVFQVLNAIN